MLPPSAFGARSTHRARSAAQADARVVSLEGVNARALSAAALPHATYDLIVIDVSFISLTLVDGQGAFTLFLFGLQLIKDKGTRTAIVKHCLIKDRLGNTTPATDPFAFRCFKQDESSLVPQ